MRHSKNFNHLSRKSAHRKAMLANMATSLIMHKRIRTTTAKAKALRTFVEPIITRSKVDSTHSRREVFKRLGNKVAVSELFREVATKVGDRPGGYTRIIKLDYRPGDNADMCIIELVDYNENLLPEKVSTKAKTSRRKRGGKKKAGAGEDVITTAEATKPEMLVEEPDESSESEADIASPEMETPAEIEEPDMEEIKAEEEDQEETEAASEEKSEIAEEKPGEPEAEPETGNEPETETETTNEPDTTGEENKEEDNSEGKT